MLSLACPQVVKKPVKKVVKKAAPKKKAPIKKKIAKKCVRRARPSFRTALDGTQRVLAAPRGARRILFSRFASLSFRRSAKGQSFALRQRNTVGGGTGSIVGLVQDIGGTLLTPTQLYFVLGWLALVLKFLIFYDK